eukprot:TRINITY_DN111027_c0_g1_i1.p1 TRINITY_DN111027_c0_g1~~TRINITY_DN111027_c0_g1_i1.p1  ORF type:complete len:224 (+),score=56.90 TRINITY_DN111027_c0_g1_i1:74-673(+)
MGQLCCREIDDFTVFREALQEAPEEHCHGDELDTLMRELFRLHDLNGNGLLEIEELVQLNSKVALLHYGKDVDLMAVKARYRELFKQRLDADGNPVRYEKFRAYVNEVLHSMDPDPLAQEMILEQFAAEARSARAVFHLPSFSSHADKGFLPHLSFHANSFMGRSPLKKGISMDEVPPSVPLSPQKVARLARQATAGGA